MDNSDFALILFCSNLDMPFTKPHCRQVRKIVFTTGHVDDVISKAKTRYKLKVKNKDGKSK